MSNSIRLFLTVLLSTVISCSMAQKDSTHVVPKWGIDVSYTGMTVTESSVVGFQVFRTTKHHALALGPHIIYHDLFEGQRDWARFGMQFTYSYFPIRSNRLFSPFLFYDLNYSYIKAKRQVILIADDGVSEYGAMCEVVTNSIAHHFGIGTRVNIYRGLFLHLNAGAGIATFGDVITHRSLQSAYPDTRESEHPFSQWEPAFMFRFGIAYQVGVDDRKKAQGCCE